MRVEIITSVSGRAGHHYAIAVLVDGVTRYTLAATPGTVLKIRNRENARWSNIADVVTANAVPPIVTLNNATSWRNYGK